MDWLSQNWAWVVVFVGGYFLMTRMGGCGMGMRGCDIRQPRDHAVDDHKGAEDNAEIVPVDANQGRRESNRAH